MAVEVSAVATKPFNIRLPEDVRAIVERLAAQEYRSLNNQIIVLLREALVRRGELAPAADQSPALHPIPDE